MNNKSADQTVPVFRLVCTFDVRKQQSQGFLREGPYDVEAQASWPPPGYAPDNEQMQFSGQKNCSVFIGAYAPIWSYYTLL